MRLAVALRGGGAACNDASDADAHDTSANVHPMDAASVVVLVQSLMNPDLETLIMAPNPPEEIGIDWSGLALVVVAFVGPFMH